MSFSESQAEQIIAAVANSPASESSILQRVRLELNDFDSEFCQADIDTLRYFGVVIVSDEYFDDL